MGMYDYINGEQVKCFYTPLFCDYELLDDTCISHSGGSLKSFNTGDIVPINTLAYNYPSDFVIYDYRNDDFVHIIRDSKVFNTVKIRDLYSKDILNLKIIDNYGRTLNIKSSKDFFNLNKDFLKFFNTKIELINEMKSNPSNRNEILDKSITLSNEFNSKWIVLEFEKEKYLGELADCYLWLKKNNDSENHSRDLKRCKELLSTLFLNEPNIVELYSKWNKNKEHLNLINQIKKEVAN